MNDLISRKDLYERAKTLEAQALDYVGRLNERDGEEFSTEWKIWSAILIERTAFKHDVYDAKPAPQWIPVKYRPMTEEEKAYWLDRLWYDGECELGDNMIFDCQMPDDEQKILVCSKCGNIWIDTHEDDAGLMGLEGNGDWEGIVAWMPLPEPYKEENNEQVQG